MVRIFDKRQRQIAVHAKDGQKVFCTNPAHLASAKISGVERGTAHQIRRVSLIGKECAKWAEAMLAARGIQGVRVLLGFLSLTTKDSSQELDRACGVALSHGAFRLQAIRRLLLEPSNDEKQLSFLEVHPVIRQMSEYEEFVHESIQEGLMSRGEYR